MASVRSRANQPSKPKREKMSEELSNRIDLSGQVAVITGGGGGIGSRTANVLPACGAKMVICDINREAAEKVSAEIGKEAIAVVGDVTQEASAKREADETIARWGALTFCSTMPASGRLAVRLPTMAPSGRNPPIDEMLTIEPRPFSTIRAPADRHIW